MRVLLTADWHIGVTQYGVLNDQGHNSRVADVEAVIHRVIDFAEKEQVELFIMAGDIFQTNRPTPEDQRVFWRILMHLDQTEMFSRFIIGNHDHNSKLGSSHALKLFMDFLGYNKKISIYDETAWESFNSLIDDEQPLLVCFYPYRGVAPDWADMAQHGAIHASAVVCHSHLEGAVVGAEPFEIKDDDATRFNQLPVDFVWAGHIHKPQILGNHPLAVYPGSIHCVDFNERNDTKGVVLFDTVERSYECAGFETRRFMQIDLDDRAHVIDADLYEVSEAIVKVNITLDEKHIDKFDEMAIRKRLIDAGAHAIASINLTVNRQQVLRDPDIKMERGLKNNFTKFIEGRDYGKHTDKVKEFGEQIIQECQ